MRNRVKLGGMDLVVGSLRLAVLAAVVLVGGFAPTAAKADPYPPTWAGNVVGGSLHFLVQDWPGDGDWIPYTQGGGNLEDQRDQDPSNGGTSPQNYVNVASGCIDVTAPSIWYYYANDTFYFRWRVQQPAHTYATGPNPGSFAATDPWRSALWTVLFDVDGDGFREFAVQLDGSSGAPSTQIDRITSYYSNTNSQLIDSGPPVSQSYRLYRSGFPAHPQLQQYPDADVGLAKRQRRDLVGLRHHPRHQIRLSVLYGVLGGLPNSDWDAGRLRRRRPDSDGGHAH